MITNENDTALQATLTKIDTALETLIGKRLHFFQELAQKYKAYRNLSALNANQSTDNTFPGFESNVSAELWEQLRGSFGDLNVYLDFPGIEKDKIDLLVEACDLAIYIENKMYYSPVEPDYRNDFDKVRQLVTSEDNAVGILIHFQFYENRNKPAHAIFERFNDELANDQETYWANTRVIGNAPGPHFLRFAFMNKAAK